MKKAIGLILFSGVSLALSSCVDLQDTEGFVADQIRYEQRQQHSEDRDSRVPPQQADNERARQSDLIRH